MIPHRFSYQGAASGQMVSLVAPPLSNGTYKDALGSCQVGHPSQILVIRHVPPSRCTPLKNLQLQIEKEQREKVLVCAVVLVVQVIFDHNHI